MVRHAEAVWTGDLKSGHGSISAPGGALTNTPYSFASRFEEANGTNPEELVAAAHAGCFSMAFSLFLANAGFTPEKIATTAHATLEQVEGDWTVTKIHLVNESTVPGIENEQFQELAHQVKEKCPISRLLAAAELTLEAKLA